MSKIYNKLYSSIFIACLVSSCSGGSSGNSGLAENKTPDSISPAPVSGNLSGQKVIAYAKNNKLYKYEMYVGDLKKPALVVHYTRSELPKDIKQYTYASLKEFIASRPNLDSHFHARIQLDTPGNPEQKWLAVGYLPSTQNMLQGSGNNACYYTGANGNPITADTNKLSTSTDFAVTSASSSDQKILANTTNVSASFMSFKAHANVTYSNDYAFNTSYNNYTLAAAVGTVIDTGIPSTNNLTPNGLAMLKQSPNIFIQNCGTSGIQAYVGGILTTLNLGVKISNQNTAESFAADVGASYSTYVSVNNAFKYLNTQSKDASAVTFTYNLYGDIDFTTPQNGAPDYATFIGNAIAANQEYLNKCSASPVDISSCTAYNTNMATTIMSGTLLAQSAIKDNPQAAASTLYPFPNGIDLANEENPNNNQSYKNPIVSNDPNNPYIAYVPVSDESKVVLQDPYVAAAQHMQNAYSVAWQLNSLAARANVLSALPNINTAASQRFLASLASLYAADSAKVSDNANQCYISIASTGSDKACLAQPNFTIAENEFNGISVNLNSIPNNVYELYGAQDEAGSPDLPDLLLKNALALQYHASYLEVGTGIVNAGANKGAMIRAANQIGFAMAYYNNALNDSEFFGGINTAPNSNQQTGYIFINTKIPVLGNTTPNNTYTNRYYTGKQDGTVGSFWWQPWGGNNIQAINGLVNYPAAPLYFVVNNPNLIPLDTPVADAVKNTTSLTASDCSDPYSPNSYSCAIFNKIVGGGQATLDSSAMNKNTQIMFNQTNTIDMPNITQLAEGKPLPGIGYTFNGSAISSNGLNSTCLAGVYLPPISKSKVTGDLLGYGEPDTLNSYICADPNNNIIYLGLGNTGNYSIAQIAQNATLSLTPNKHFFGAN